MLRLAMALLGCGALLALAPAARADEPAAVMHDRECTPVGGAATYCTSITLVQHSADQPDGDQSYVYHYELTEELTGPTGVLFASRIADDIHFVTVDGLMQELHMRSYASADVPGFTCRFATVYHYANGQVQIDRNEVAC
jgi:hypothetical protein